MILRLTEEQKRLFIEDVVRRVKDKVIALSEAQESSNSNVQMINIEDPNEIAKYINDVYAIFQASYAHIGGFLGTRDANALLHKTILLTLCMGNEHIYSAAAYSNFYGGYKMFGAGSDGSDVGKRGVEEIVKRDIENFKEWHWSEVSGAMERIFEKNNGYAIPSFYASEILHNKKIQIIDETHYSREIAGETHIKVIYGFKDEALYNKVMGIINGWDESAIGTSQEINEEINIRESSETPEEKRERRIGAAYRIIGTISDNMDEREMSELTPYQVEMIKRCLDVLYQFTDDNRSKRGIDLGEYMLNSYPVITCNSFDV